jgi:phosphoribosyl-AMP cyclohydrolase
MKTAQKLILSWIYWPFFEKRGGVVPLIVQDAETKEVLKVTSVDKTGFLEILSTGLLDDTDRIIKILIDCDGDALICLTEAQGNESILYVYERYPTRPNFEKFNGVVCVVTQDTRTGEVLMVAYTDEAGLNETRKNGLACYRSTSRNERWLKGETSGNTQAVLLALIARDGDSINYWVEPKGDGVACHTGARSCFFRSIVGCVDFENPKLGEKEKLSKVRAEVHPRLLQ